MAHSCGRSIVHGTGSIIILPPILTVNPFTFIDVTNALPAIVFTSNTVTLSGFNVSQVATITGPGLVSFNGGPFVAVTSFVVNAGDNVALQATSQAALSGVTNTTLTVGATSDTWSITTVASMPVINAALDITLGKMHNDTISAFGSTTGTPAVLATGLSFAEEDDYFAEQGGLVDAVEEGDTLDARLLGPAQPVVLGANQNLLPLLQAVFPHGVVGIIQP
jgi:hypothetical protein